MGRQRAQSLAQTMTAEFNRLAQVVQHNQVEKAAQAVTDSRAVLVAQVVMVSQAEKAELAAQVQYMAVATVVTAMTAELLF